MSVNSYTFDRTVNLMHPKSIEKRLEYVYSTKSTHNKTQLRVRKSSKTINAICDNFKTFHVACDIMYVLGRTRETRDRFLLVYLLSDE